MLPLFQILNADDVLSLSRQQIDQTQPDQNGRTPLHQAVASNATDCALWLLDASDAAVNMADGQGETPLMRAAWLGNRALVNRLLERGAGVSAASRAGGTALHHAFAAERNSGQIVEVLLAHGADDQAPDKEGRLPAQWEALGKASRQGQEFLRQQRAPRVLSLRR